MIALVIIAVVSLPATGAVIWYFKKKKNREDKKIKELQA